MSRNRRTGTPRKPGRSGTSAWLQRHVGRAHFDHDHAAAVAGIKEPLGLAEVTLRLHHDDRPVVARANRMNADGQILRPSGTAVDVDDLIK